MMRYVKTEIDLESCKLQFGLSPVAAFTSFASVTLQMDVAIHSMHDIKYKMGCIENQQSECSQQFAGMVLIVTEFKTKTLCTHVRTKVVIVENEMVITRKIWKKVFDNQIVGMDLQNAEEEFDYVGEHLLRFKRHQ